MHVTGAILWPVLVGALVVCGQGETLSGSPSIGLNSVGPVAMSMPLPAGQSLAASKPRPENGARLINRGAEGEGALAIINGTSQDAVVTLAVGETTASYAVYVHAGANARIGSIADETYTIFVQQGAGWNNDLQQFTADAQYKKFDSPATFTTTQDSKGIQYTEFSITLQPVPDGNVRPVPVGPDEVPK